MMHASPLLASSRLSGDERVEETRTGCTRGRARAGSSSRCGRTIPVERTAPWTARRTRVSCPCSRVHSWAVVRSHVQRREDGHARPRGGALDRSGIVLPHRDELPARARPRVQPVRVSSTRSSPERRDDARRRDACIIDQMKTSSFNRRRAHSSPSVRALARERNDGANERTRDRWNVDVSRLDAMTRRTVRIGSIRFVQKSARRVNERTSGMIVFCRRESRNQKAGGDGTLHSWISPILLLES